MIRGKLALIPAMSSSRPACPPMNTNPSWIRIGNSTSSGADTHAPSPPAATSHAARDAEPRHRRARRRAIRSEVEPLRAPGDGAGDDDPGHADRDVRHRQPRRAVRVEEHRVGDDARAARPSRRRPATGPSASARPPARLPRARSRGRRVGLGAGSFPDHRDERLDDPARERRPIGEQLVEDRLVDPEQQSSARARSPTRSAAPARARPARRRSSRRPATRPSGRRGGRGDDPRRPRTGGPRWRPRR